MDNINLSDIYKSLVEAQESLHVAVVEYRKLPVISRKRMIDNEIPSELMNQFLKDKIHYMKVLLYYISEYDNNDAIIKLEKIDNYYTNIIDEVKYYDPEIKTGNDFPDLDSNQSVLIDIITFSTLPSIFQFFIDYENSDLFFNFIKTLPNNYLKLKFSRSLFVSPLFLNFTREVFYEIMKTICNNADLNLRSKKNIKCFKDKIVESFKKNLKYFPIYIYELFSEMKETISINEIIKENFIGPMAYNPSMFLIIDPWKLELEENKARILNFLNDISDDLVKDFSDILKKNDSRANLYLCEFNFESNVKFYSTSVISSIDSKVIDLIFNKQKKTNEISDIINSLNESENYRLVKVFFMKENNDISQSNSPSLFQSQIPTDENIENLLYKILKDTPSAPANVKFDEDECKVKGKGKGERERELLSKVKNMIEKYFVDFCDLSYRSSTVYCFEKLFSEHTNLSKNALYNAITSIKDNPNLEYFEIQSCYDILQQIKLISSQKSAAIDLYDIPFYSYVSAKVFHFKNIDPSWDACKISNHPSEFLDKFLNSIKELYNSKGYVQVVNALYHRFFKSLSFNLFLVQRPDLVRYDNFCHKVFYINFLKISQDINASVLNELDTSQFREFGYLLCKAFESDVDPLEKASIFLRIYKLIYRKYVDLNKDLPDPSIVIDCFINLIAEFNPNHVISSFVYIFDFMPPSIRDATRSDICELLQIAAYIKQMLNSDKNTTSFKIGITDLSINFQKVLNFIITGDDPNFILDVYNILKAGIKSRIAASDEDLTSEDNKALLSSIKSNRVINRNLGKFGINDFQLDVTLNVVKKAIGWADQVKFQGDFNYTIFAFSNNNRAKSYLNACRQDTNLNLFLTIVPDNANPVDGFVCRKSNEAVDFIFNELITNLKKRLNK